MDELWDFEYLKVVNTLGALKMQVCISYAKGVVRGLSPGQSKRKIYKLRVTT
jgi:hypothetical protein